MAHLMNPWREALMDNSYTIHVSLTDCYIQGGFFHTSFTDSSARFNHARTGVHAHASYIIHIAAFLIAMKSIDLWMDRQADTNTKS